MPSDWLFPLMELSILVNIEVPQPEMSTFCSEDGSVEKRQKSSLPERIAAIHQFVTAALEASLKAHLSTDHPPLRRQSHTHVTGGTP